MVNSHGLKVRRELINRDPVRSVRITHVLQKIQILHSINHVYRSISAMPSSFDFHLPGKDSINRDHDHQCDDDELPELSYSSSTGTSSTDETDFYARQLLSDDDKFQHMLLDQLILQASAALEEARKSIEELSQCCILESTIPPSDCTLCNDITEEQQLQQSRKVLHRKATHEIEDAHRFLEHKRNTCNEPYTNQIDQYDIDQVTMMTQKILHVIELIDSNIKSNQTSTSAYDLMTHSPRTDEDEENERFREMILTAQEKLIKVKESECDGTFSSLLYCHYNILSEMLAEDEK